MNLIKLILAIIGLLFAGMLLLWAFSALSTVIWYLFWIGLLGAVVWGGYRLFRKIEDKALGAGTSDSIGTGDINMSWDEYDKKYLHK